MALTWGLRISAACPSCSPAAIGFLVEHFDRLLLFLVQPNLRQPLRQRVLVHFLQVPVPKIDVDSAGRAGKEVKAIRNRPQNSLAACKQSERLQYRAFSDSGGIFVFAELWVDRSENSGIRARVQKRPDCEWSGYEQPTDTEHGYAKVC
jgi:hypothetical protein